MAGNTQPPSNPPPSDAERQATEASPGLIAEFVEFLKHSKKWWLTSIIVVLLLIIILIFLDQNDQRPGPFGPRSYDYDPEFPHYR